MSRINILTKDSQIKNNTNLALVEDVDSRTTTTEDLRVVLVDSALRVADSGYILDDDDVVGMLALANRNALSTDFRCLIEEAISVDHVVDNTALADLLALKLPLSRQIVAVVVAEMVVRGNGEGLDTGIDEELGKDGLEFGLTGLQIITTDERFLALSELDDTRNKGVLRSTVDEWLTLKDSGHGKEGGGRNLGVGSLDSIEEVISSVIDTRDNVTVSLSVGSPEDDNAVQLVLLLELANVSADVFQVNLLVVPGNQVVGASLLVSSNEVRVVDRRKGLSESGHMGGDLTLEVVVQDFGTFHGLFQGEARDIPSTKDEVIGVDHRKNVRDGYVDILASTWLGSNAHSRRAKDRADVVGLLDALLSVPDDIMTIGKNSSAQSGTIVASDTDHEQTN